MSETGAGTFGAPRPVAPRLVFKAHRLVYHSTLGWRVIKKKKKKKHHTETAAGTFGAPPFRANPSTYPLSLLR